MARDFLKLTHLPPYPRLIDVGIRSEREC